MLAVGDSVCLGLSMLSKTDISCSGSCIVGMFAADIVGGELAVGPAS